MWMTFAGIVQFMRACFTHELLLFCAVPASLQLADVKVGQAPRPKAKLELRPGLGLGQSASHIAWKLFIKALNWSVLLSTGRTNDVTMVKKGNMTSYRSRVFSVTSAEIF